MGGSNSTPKSDTMMDHQPYPDMNVIFKSIPKMMQVADDMHRMTNYIMDLRNMTIGLVCLSIVGVFLFVIVKLTQGRSSAARRKRELGRRIESLEDRSLPRHTTHYGAYHGYLDSWHDSRSHKVSNAGAAVIDIEKIPMNQSQDNSSHNDTTTTPLETPNLLNGHAHKV
uniref:APP_amyloid domain-containing protein n=1 Tax=Elaeophora elaphi TaxID=1147741 RepID=A0A0R3RLV6_9BILA